MRRYVPICVVLITVSLCCSNRLKTNTGCSVTRDGDILVMSTVVLSEAVMLTFGKVGLQSLTL